MLRPIGALSIVPYRNVPRVSTVHCYACRMVRNSFDATAPSSRFRAELALAFCTLLWGSTFVVVKNSLDHSSVFLFLALRFTLAGICMVAFRPQIVGGLQREEIFAGVRLGFFMFCGYAFQTAGLRYPDRKSTRLTFSYGSISHAVFCL